MKPTFQHIDEQIIARYTDQPSVLPASLRAHIEAAWGGGPVELYAFADLDHAMRLAATWIALGPTHIAVARVPAGDAGGADVPIVESGRATAADDADVRVIEIARATAIHEAPGLSATTLSVLGAPSGMRRLPCATSKVSFANTQKINGKNNHC
jgi:hypothetical protein